LRTAEYDNSTGWLLILCLSVSGNEGNKYLNDNWRAIVQLHGKGTYKTLGLILHKILSQAATTVLYKDIFDTE
jgi:hypothetical protein